MTTWLLLRGLVRESGHWGDFPQALKRHVGRDDAVLAVDMPGNGVLHCETSPASVAGLLAACRAQARRQGGRPPYVLVALSLGGMVALEWCHRAAAEVAGCVVINTSLRRFSPAWQRLQPHNFKRLAGLLRPGLTPLQRERQVLELTSSRPQRHAGVPALWADIGRRHPVSRVNALRQLLAAARYLPPTHRPEAPVLVLASAGDRLVSPNCSASLSARWALPMHLHPGAGHDLPLDDPEWVLRRMLDWWTVQAEFGTASVQVPGTAFP